MPRKSRVVESITYEGGIKPGNVVLVESPDNFRGIRVAVVLEKQKWCKDGIPVMLADKNESVRTVCVMDHRGDKLSLIPKVSLNDSPKSTDDSST